MSRFLIDDAELEALYGLRSGAFHLYALLRSRMNYATGEVGRKPLISRWTLREAMFVEPKRGRALAESGSPSEQTIRGYEKELLDAGLIAYRSIASQKQLIFFLPLATLASVRSREEQQVSGEVQQSEVQQSPSQVGQGFAGDVQQKVQQSEAVEVQHTSGTGNTGNPYQHSKLTSSSMSPSVIGAREPTTRLDAMIEVLRSHGATVSGKEPLLLSWVKAGVTDAQLLQALSLAKQARLAAHSNQPIQAGYLDQVLRNNVLAVPQAVSNPLANGGDKPWFVAGDYPVGDKSKAAPYLAGLKQRFRTVQ